MGTIVEWYEHCALLRVARLAFLTPNFTNLAFFKGCWHQKNGLAFFLQYLAFLEAVCTCYQTGVLAF